jgi:hypothetical protein
MESKPQTIKFNPDLEAEAGKLYRKYCDEKGIECRITAAANFCLGYMVVKEAATLKAQQGGWVKGIVQIISNSKISGQPQYRRYDRDPIKDTPARCWTRDSRHALETLLASKNLDTNKNYVLVRKG